MRFCVLLLLASFSMFADQVQVKNGDRITGAIVKADGKTLQIKTEYAGVIDLAWEAVAGINADRLLHFGLDNGQMLTGTATTTGETIDVRTDEVGVVAVPMGSLRFIRSKEEQLAHEQQIERYRNPRLVDLWTGFADLGFAAARGNAKTTNLTSSANAERVTSRDKINVYFTSIYSKSEVPATITTPRRSVLTANAMRGGIRYSVNVTPTVFAFGSTDLEFDEFQRLDLRFAPAGGLGYHVLKNERTTFDVMGGGALNREFFATGLDRTSGEILLGEELVHKFTENNILHHRISLFPNLSDGGEFRLNFDTSLVTRLRRWFGWQFTVSDRYLSNPVAGRKKNDVLFTTGLRLTFAR